MRLGIVGCRYFNNWEKFSAFMERYEKEYGLPDEVVSGGAAGIDTLAERWAKEKSIPMRIFFADWNKYGRAAGPMRNTEIANNIDLLLAFPSAKSVGTYDTIRKSKYKLVTQTESL